MFVIIKDTDGVSVIVNTDKVISIFNDGEKRKIVMIEEVWIKTRETVINLVNIFNDRPSNDRLTASGEMRLESPIPTMPEPLF